jgi:ankyrin repeat protein
MARTHLPNEIILMIAQYLTPRGIANLMLGNREWYTLLRGDFIFNRTLGSSRNGIILWASQHGREDVVRAMLQRKGEFGYRHWRGFETVSEAASSELHLPLRFAAWYGHVGIIKILLDWDISTIRYDLRALPAAASSGHLEAVKVLLEYSAQLPEDKPQTPGSEEEYIEEEYIEEDSPVPVPPAPVTPVPFTPSYHGRFLNQAFVDAIRAGHDEIIEVLVADGRARISLAQASRIGSERFMKLCCASEGPNFLEEGRVSPLGVAAEAGHEGALQILFEAGWDVNLRDGYGRTPLFDAVAAGQKAIVRMLLGRKDTNPDLADNQGDTPLLEASRKGHVAIIEQLLETGNVNVNPTTSSGQSALSFVAGQGLEDSVRLFLAAGAHPDTRDHIGRSPLSLAAGAGFPVVVKMLLAVDGVDPNSKCKHSQTPLAYALLSGHFPGRVNSKKTNPTDDRDEQQMLNILQGSLEDCMACLKVEEKALGDGAALSIMKLLLEDNRVDANSRDAKGRSVLCLAILRGEHAAVRLLVSSKRIDLKSKIYRNLTPVDLVKEKYRRKRLSEWRSNNDNR